MRRSVMCVLAGMGVVLGLGAGASASKSVEATMQGVRASLASYDLDEGAVVATLSVLTGLVRDADDSSIIAEARFLRVALAADLYFLSAYTGDTDLQEAVAEAFGNELAELGSGIDAALSRAGGGVYRMAVSQVRQTLSAVKAGNLVAPSGRSRAVGVARDATLLRGISKRLGETDSVVSVFSSIGRDRCGGVGRGCDALQMSFDAPSRRAIAALTDAGKAVARVRIAAQQGDPLAGAVIESVEGDYTQVSAHMLSLTPLLDRDLFMFAEGNRASRATPQLVVVVTPDAVRYGFVPSVGLDSSGALRTHSAGQPTLPKLATLELPETYKPFIRPLSIVVTALSGAFDGQPDMRVGIGAMPDVDAHVLGRVLISLRRAGCKHAELTGRDRTGAAVAVPLQVLKGAEADSIRPAPQLRLRVKLGGYSLTLAGGTRDIPRVRQSHGFRFDTETLEAHVRKRGARSASVSFMGGVASQTLLAAMWRVAPLDSALQVVIP